MSPVSRVLDWVFGHDYFIAYAWSDGRTYAVALCDALQRQGFTCFLDSSNFAKGDDWKSAGLRHLRKSGVLILVGTAGALKSEAAYGEVRLFSGLGRRIVPIDVDGSLTTSLQSSRIGRYVTANHLRISEAAAQAAVGPSDRTLIELSDSFNLARQNTKRARMLSAVAGALAVLSVAAVYFGVDAKRQQNIAEDNLRDSRTEQLAAAADLAVLSRPYSATQGLLVSLEALKLTFRPAAYSAWQRSAQLLPPIKSSLEHASELTWVGYEQQAQLLYTLTAAGELSAWNAPFTGHPAGRWITDAKVLSVGRASIAVAHSSSGITVYDVAAGTQTKLFSSERIAQLAHDEQGATLAAGDLRGSVYLWSALQREPKRVQLNDAPIGSMSFASCGTKIAVSVGNDVFVLTAPDLRPHLRVRLSASPTQLRFSPDAQYLAMGHATGVVQLIDVRSGKATAEISGDRGRAVSHLVFLPLSKLLAVSYASGRVRIADLTTGLVVRELRHNGIVTTLQVDPPGDHLVVGSEDGNTYLWTLATDELKARPDMAVPVRFAHYDAQNHLLFHAGGKRVVVRNLKDGDVYRQFPGTLPRIVSLAQATDGSLVAAAGGIGSVRWWNSGDWTKSRLVSTGIGNAAMDVAVSSDGSLVAATTRDYTAVWKAADASLAAKILSEESTGLTVAIAGQSLFIGRQNGSAELRDLQTGVLRSQLKLGTQAVQASSGHPSLPYFAVPADSELRLIDDSGKVLERWPLEAGDAVTALSLAARDSQLAYGTAKGLVRIIDWRTSRVLWQRQTGDQVRRLSFSRDGKSVAIASGSLTSVMRAGSAMGYEVWDWRAKRLLATFPNVGEVNAVLMLQDGSIATEGPLGSMRVWRWKLEDLMESSARRVDRGLSETERERFLLTGR
jgi:WD40 repeat protein